MEIINKIGRRVGNGLIEIRSTFGAVGRIGIISQAYQDVGIVESKRELIQLSDLEVFSRVNKLGKEMADMTPDELQEFVNSKIDPIEDPRRKRNARLFLQIGIKKHLSEKTE